MVIVEGVGASCAAILQKIRILDIKKNEKIKKKSDRPTLCKTCYVTLNTHFFGKIENFIFSIYLDKQRLSVKVV